MEIVVNGFYLTITYYGSAITVPSLTRINVILEWCTTDFSLIHSFVQSMQRYSYMKVTACTVLFLIFEKKMEDETREKNQLFVLSAAVMACNAKAIREPFCIYNNTK